MSSSILINPFEVPKGKEKQAVHFWKMAAEFMRQQPGFVSTRLHESVAPLVAISSDQYGWVGIGGAI